MKFYIQITQKFWVVESHWTSAYQLAVVLKNGFTIFQTETQLLRKYYELCHGESNNLLNRLAAYLMRL